jgi:predicted enzyme related to lactoylglutathione lyase
MGENESYTPGTFCWVDLATPDSTGSKRFYGELSGWEAIDTPAGPDGTYTRFELDGKDVCAAFEMNEAMRNQGVPPHWQSYVSVADADASAAKAKELGGSVLMGPFDVMQAGRMAMVQDPLGAVLSLWQPREHCGAQILNQPGCLCWNELHTTDTSAVQDFYRGLFGWTARADSGSPQYFQFENAGRMVGGMIEIQPEWGDVPPNWAVYFAVADFDASLEKAKSLGANAFMPPKDVEEVSRFAMVGDPQGACFAMIQLKQDCD